ncbi:MAG: alpha/beta hydrolase [Tunicatimonas sp.]|uniref:alpha/beta hydrolase n=1 Tax=Tunicatimonas sp. TaxID=1940096 RepID=UPI003C71E0DE
MLHSDHYILAHGLNVQPTVMQLLAEELGCAEDQYTVISLPGHSGEENLSRDSADRWLESFQDQYNEVFRKHTDVVFVGYSLGGLIMTYLLGNGQVAAPRKQILLAPALAFQQWTKIPTMIPKATLDQVTIPSFTPKSYKANSGVSLGAYKVLFAISQELNSMISNRYNIPTLVFCDRWDELVQAEGLRKFINAKKLTEWKLIVVSSSFWQRLGKKHLLVAKEYYSDNHWKQIRQQIEAFVDE